MKFPFLAFQVGCPCPQDLGGVWGGLVLGYPTRRKSATNGTKAVLQPLTASQHPPPHNSSRQSLPTPKGREKVTCCVQPHLQGISQSQASQLHPREVRNQPWLQGLPGSTLRGLGLHSTQITPKGATCKAVPRAASVHKETSHPGALLSLLLLAL